MPFPTLIRRAALLLPFTFHAYHALSAQSQAAIPSKLQAASPTLLPNSPWLFAGFKRDSKDGVYYAISLDGYHWKLANGGKPVIPPTDPNELMRDPFLQRAPGGSFRMVWSWAWYDAHVVGYSESKDLLTWTPHRPISVMSLPEVTKMCIRDR